MKPKFPDVHPEIRKFYEQKDLKVETRLFESENDNMLWDVTDGGLILYSIGYTYVDRESQYFWPPGDTDKLIPESQMLRCIRQKAFL